RADSAAAAAQGLTEQNVAHDTDDRAGLGLAEPDERDPLAERRTSAPMDIRHCAAHERCFYARRVILGGEEPAALQLDAERRQRAERSRDVRARAGQARVAAPYDLDVASCVLDVAKRRSQDGALHFRALAQPVE